MPDKQTGHSRHHSASYSALLPQAVAAKPEDGNVRAAIRILNSEDSPEPPSLASLSKLQEKHLSASGMDPALPLPSQLPSITMDETEVRKAVLFFPAGSSGGPATSALMRPDSVSGIWRWLSSGSHGLCWHGAGWTLSTWNQLAWYAKTPRDQMVSRWFHLKAAGHWRGTWLLSAPRLTLTLIWQCKVLAVMWACGGQCYSS